jgi:hypothetical protein
MRLGTGPSGATLESLHTVRRVAPISGEHLVVRRETGKEEVVRVHCDEGVANHVGPEPCAGIREGIGEASVGVRAGQPLSREIVLISGADAVTRVEGKTEGRVIASVRPTRRGHRPWHVRKLLAREPGDLWIGHEPQLGRMVRSGKAMSRSR